MALKKSLKRKPRRSRLARLHAIAERQAEIREQLENACHQDRNIQQFGREHANLVAVAKTMLETCLDTHQPVCAKHPFNRSKFQPTRLIDLEYVERPKLVVSSAIKDRDRRYICLSHQWGGPDEQAKLAMTTVTENIQARLDGFSLWSLPARYQEVMMICHFLGVRYMWIDSLCIIQDRIEDWKSESVMMARIYECGFLTIGSNLPVPGQEWKPPYPRQSNLQSIWMSEMLTRGPLASRAWCLQERYLSPRLLYIFARKTWIWECDSRIRAATPNGPLFSSDIRGRKQSWRKFIMDARLSRTQLLDLWYKIVVDYSGRSLTFESDKLPAISGIAAKMEKLLGTDYLAGIWSDDLYGLMWRRKQISTNDEGPEIMRVPRHYRAPSWSWASADESVEFVRGSGLDRSTVILLASAVHYNIIVSSKGDPSSGIKQGSSLNLTSYFYEPRVSSDSSPEIGRIFFDYRCEKSMPKKIFYFVIGIRLGQVIRQPPREFYRHTPSRQILPWPHELFGLLLKSPKEGVFERVGVFETTHKLPRKALARSRRSAPTYEFKATLVDAESVAMWRDIRWVPEAELQARAVSLLGAKVDVI